MGVAEELDRFSTDDYCLHGQGTPKFQAPEVASGLSNRFLYVYFLSSVFLLTLADRIIAEVEKLTR